MGISNEFTNMDAIAQANLVHRKEVRPIELVEAAVERIERLNPKLNAVIHKMYEQAREVAGTWASEIDAGRASSVIFCGVPFLLKDFIAEYEGAPFNEGSRAVRGYVSKLDSEIVRRQKAGGLVVIGKTKPLALHRMELASFTPCRFLPAHPQNTFFFIWYTCILCDCYFGLNSLRKSPPADSRVLFTYGQARKAHKNSRIPKVVAKLHSLFFLIILFLANNAINCLLRRHISLPIHKN